MANEKQYRQVLREAEKSLADSTNAAITDRIDLRDAVCAYLEAEEARGIALPTIVESIEQILRRAEIRAGPNAESLDGHRELTRQIIDWCIQFRDTRSSN